MQLVLDFLSLKIHSSKSLNETKSPPIPLHQVTLTQFPSTYKYNFHLFILWYWKSNH